MTDAAREIDRHLAERDHVIWDWNGTLLDDIAHSLAVVNRLLFEDGLPAIDRDRYRATFRFPVIDYYRDLGFDVTPPAFAALCERFTKHFHDDLHACALWPGARELLARIKTSGRQQSVLSLTRHDLLAANLAHFGVAELFDVVAGHADTRAASKIERGRKLVDESGVPAARTILIGDTDHDLEVGRAIGIDVLLVEHGHQHAVRLRTLHDRVVKLF